MNSEQIVSKVEGQIRSVLWEGSWTDGFNDCKWSKSDPRLSPSRFTSLTPEWTWETPLRTDYERRQVLVEIDVLTAMALGMTLEQIKTIYRIQFPVLQQYDADTWYDDNGRIVFTVNKGLTGVGFSRHGKYVQPAMKKEIDDFLARNVAEPGFNAILNRKMLILLRELAVGVTIHHPS